jgi:hypothetical protein
MHAAYGASHVWAAAIIAGLAVVITGAIAFNTQAATTDAAPSLSAVFAGIQKLNARMDHVDAALAKISVQCAGTQQAGGQNSNTDQNPNGGSCADRCRNAQATGSADFNLDACIKNCQNPLTPPSASTTGTQTGQTGNSCLVTCSQSTLSCLKAAGDSSSSRQKCLDADKSCRSACTQPPSNLAPIK